MRHLLASKGPACLLLGIITTTYLPTWGIYFVSTTTTTLYPSAYWALRSGCFGPIFSFLVQF